MQSIIQETAPDALWAELSPLLDEAMSRLGTTDRDALVLRYFQNKSLSEVGAAMGLEERTAQKRVTRAIEKLRKFFAQRGVTLTATAIAGAVSANSVQAAPVALVKTISAIAVAKGAAATASTLTLVKGALKLMAWAKMKMAVGVSVGIILMGSVIVISLSAKSNREHEEQLAPPIASHAGVTFFSMLEKTPIIANAVFEKELFMDGVPAQARKQTFSFLSDGDNHQLSTEGIATGKFEGSSWQQINDNLDLFDPKLNKPDGYSGGVVEQESICKMTIDLFLTLGIRGMLPGSAVWDQDKHRFTAKTKDGKDLVVETTLENGVPATAYVLADDGQRYEKIQFQYSPGFYGGQVPIEFTAYWITPGIKNKPSTDQKEYDIRVKTLDISDDHLDKTLLDPTKIAGSSARFFYSNNIEYWIGKGGKASRVLTIEEANKEVESIKANNAKR